MQLPEGAILGLSVFDTVKPIILSQPQILSRARSAIPLTALRDYGMLRLSNI